MSDPANTIAFQGHPGAYSDMACRSALSGDDDAAVPRLRRCLRRGARRCGGARHDPDRKLRRRTRRRHPSLAARFGPQHRRRALSTREPSPARGQGGDPRRHHPRAQPHPGPRPMPQPDSGYGRRAGRTRRYGGRRGGRGGAGRQDPGRHRIGIGGRTGRTDQPQGRHRGRRAQYDAVRGHVAGPGPCPTPRRRI